MTTKNWDFDKIIDRKNTGCLKWDFTPEIFSCSNDVLPLWIADMDFKLPEPLINNLVNRAKHGIFGYTGFNESYYTAVINWYQRRHNWTIKREWFEFSPGIIPAINFIIQEFSEKGDKIILQNPVYYPFYDAIRNNHREFQFNPLKYNKETKHYEMDFDDLAEKAKDPSVKIMILCSPHNPIGRVWTQKELEKVGRICIDNNILIISDEIHCDLIYPDHKHTNFASMSDEFAQNSITCTSVSKTFNLAGLQLSNIIIPNEEIRKRFTEKRTSLGISGPNSFGPCAMEVAYNECEDWLDALIEYLGKNREFVKTYFKNNFPELDVIEPEGTYLLWTDFRKLGISHKDLEKMMLKDAKVALDEGYIFGEGGEGFERFNLATPRAILEDCLNRIKNAVENMRK